jgi:hypothetical protein
MWNMVHPLEAPRSRVQNPIELKINNLFCVWLNFYIINFVKPNITFWFYLIIQHECVEPALWVWYRTLLAITEPPLKHAGPLPLVLQECRMIMKQERWN